MKSLAQTGGAFLNFAVVLISSWLVLGLLTSAFAQEYPAQPIRLALRKWLLPRSIDQPVSS